MTIIKNLRIILLSLISQYKKNKTVNILNERSNSTGKVSYEGEAINTRIDGERFTAENFMDILGKIIRHEIKSKFYLQYEGTFLLQMIALIINLGILESYYHFKFCMRISVKDTLYQKSIYTFCISVVSNSTFRSYRFIFEF